MTVKNITRTVKPSDSTQK
uniref:Uncharacterized protein n=1 Tax=Anguilla anguilla TaxID=7936 RepID=A0A0E9VF31_ANGAN